MKDGEEDEEEAKEEHHKETLGWIGSVTTVLPIPSGTKQSLRLLLTHLLHWSAKTNDVNME